MAFNFPSLLLLLLAATTSFAVLATAKKTQLQFYVHVINSGPNATTAVVAGLNKTSSAFGNIDVYDNILRVGTDPSSAIIGRIQGIDAQASLGSPAVTAVYNFVFTGGAYNGSTLGMMGYHIMSQPTWEQSVIAGTGQFRLARGYAIAQLVSYTPAYIVINFNAYVLH
nr:dirigent [Lilium regale]